MAKELPYFKFEPNEWENGNIQILDREQKGLFIDLCCMYWSRLGDLPKKLAIQKLCNGNATALDLLCEENVIQVIDGNIFIKFLSEQLNEFEDKGNTNRENALKGWEKRRKLKKELNDATALQTHSETDAIREDKIKEDKIKKENIINITFDDFWDLYDKKVGEKEKLKNKWNKLSDSERELIMKFIPEYKKSQPDKKYRKNPDTFLNQKSWNDELIFDAPKKQVKQFEKEDNQRGLVSVI